MEAVNTSSEIQDEFLTLLVTQLRNQDPLEPVSQENFVAQLAQFSQLSGIEQLNSNFEDMLTFQADMLKLEELNVGSSLIGQDISYFDPSDPTQVRTGTVQQLTLAQGRVAFDVGNDLIYLQHVVNISEGTPQ